MKQTRRITFYLLCLILIFTYLAQGNHKPYQLGDRKSLDSSSMVVEVSSLRNNEYLPDFTDFFHVGNKLRITNSTPHVFAPGRNIHLRSRFNTTEIPSYAVVNQDIKIFLNPPSDPISTDSKYLHVTGSTNGPSPPIVPAFTTNSLYGWLDTIITLPDMNWFTNNGISAGDTVTIHQYYPSGNVSSLIQGIDPISVLDNFTLVGFATISEVGSFVNPNSNDASFRPGEGASVLLKAESEGTSISGVEVSCDLRYSNNGSIIPNGTNGMEYYLEDKTTGNPSTTTDGSGEIRLRVSTTYPDTPEVNYYINITGDFDGTGYFTENYDGSPSSNYHSSSANFTINNEEDTVSVQFITATGFTSSDPKGDNGSWPLNPPRENITIVTFRVQATTVYNGSSTYYLKNIPVNATLDFGGGNPEGVYLNGAGFKYNGSWAFTNATGYVEFNITAIYPTLWRDKTPTINAIANIKNGSAPIYPVTSPHRFLTQGNITGSQVISIDPDYQVGWIYNSWQLNDHNIRPGENTTLRTRIYLQSNYYNGSYHQNFDIGAFVPVKVELVSAVPGVFLTFNDLINPLAGFSAGYRLTDASGYINVVVNSTYGVSPEYRSNIQIRITADFENDTKLRWIGPYHAGTNTLTEFNKTWNTRIESRLAISSNYTVCRIYTSHYYENGTYYSSGNAEARKLRPGDYLDVYFRVQEVVASVYLDNVPVNVSLNVSVPGVTLTVIYSNGVAPNSNNYYYLTQGVNGQLGIRLSTTRGLTPKNVGIKLTATADFTNDSRPWHVGQKNYTQYSSYSDTNQSISIIPQYFTGQIYLAGGLNPNATKVLVNQTVRITFNLKLLNGEGEWVTGVNMPDIDGINITLEINDRSPSFYNMAVLPAQSQISETSSVTFDIVTNATGITPEDVYTIKATANFQTDDALTYNFSSPYPLSVSNGKLSGAWVNGSNNFINSSITQVFEVRDISLVSLKVDKIVDPFHPDAGANNVTGYYDVFRGTTTITIKCTYADVNRQPNIGVPITISFNYTQNAVRNTYNLITNTTDSQGKFTVHVTVPSSIPLQDIQIYGWDTTSPDPQEDRTPIERVRLVSTINIVNHALSGFRGSAVFVGESVTITGSLQDDQNNNINDTELVNGLRVIGWNGTHEVTGSEVIGGTYSNGAYLMQYHIPLSYPGNSIVIRFNITSTPQLLHYRPNFNDSLNVLVYRDFQIDSLRIFFPYNSTETSVSNDSLILVKQVENRDIAIRGTLVDSLGRPLDGKQLNDTWNLLFSPLEIVDALSNFSITHSFSGWQNITTLTWEVYHVLDNGTVLSKHFTLTFKWEVYDETEPRISITSPTGPNPSVSDVLAPSTNTTIIVSIFDPDNTTDSGYISGGLDEASVMIYIDDVGYSMLGTAPTFTHSWDPSPPTDTEYNITITASDNAGNLATSETLFVIDIKIPTASMNYNESNGYLSVNSNGDIIITGSIVDSSSSTGKDSEVGDSTVELTIQNETGVPILILDDIDLAVSGGSFFYAWNVYDPITLAKVSPFSESDQWTLVLTFEDWAGNIGTLQEDVQLDNTPPSISVSSQPLATVIDTVSVTVTFSDVQTGMNNDSLVFEFISSATQTTLDSFYPNDDEVDISPDSASLTFDVAGESPGSYFIKVSIYDNAANVAEVDSNDFTIQEPPEPTTTPTTEPPDPLGVLLTPVDILIFLIIDLIALGGGFGIAVLYERFRKSRRI